MCNNINKNIEVHYHTDNYATPKKVIGCVIAVALIAIAIGTLALLHQNHTLNFFPEIGKIPMVGSQVLTGIGSSLALGGIITAVVYTIQHLQKKKPLEKVYADIRNDPLPSDFEKNKPNSPWWRGTQNENMHSQSSSRTLYWIKAYNFDKLTLEYHLFLNNTLRDNFIEKEIGGTEFTF